jgi:hypothetical protein
MFTAPAGKPTASAAWANQAFVKGVNSGDFMTRLLPVASAAESERAVISTG